MDRLIGLKYELIAELGSDVVFDVWKALDRSRARPVKIRLVREPFNLDAGFIQELGLVCQQHEAFQHQGLERVLDLAEQEGQYYIVSDYEDGSVLEDRLKRLTTFSIPGALSTAVSIAEALEACHQAGMVHGDLSTRTIFSRQSEGVKLMMAGYWRAYAQNPVTAKALVPAMAPYLAPEISTGDMPSISSDIYALGVVLFRIMTGRFPFTADTPAALIQQHISSLPPSLRKVNPSVPQALDQIVMKCLAKRPQDRYQSAKAALQDLRLLQDSLRFGRPVRLGADEPADQVTNVQASKPKPVPAPVPSAEEERARRAEEESRAKPEEEPDRLLQGISWVTYAIGFVVMLCVGIWVYWWFSSPPSVEVPNLIGRNVQEAKEALLKIGLPMKTKEVASEQPRDTVLSLDPPPGRKAKTTWGVMAEISAGSFTVSAPNLRGLTQDEAIAKLTPLKLEISPDVQTGAERGMEFNRIISQSPEAGSKIAVGTKIKIVVNAETTSGGEGSDRRWRRWTLQIALPDRDTSMKVRVEMTDADGAVDTHNESHDSGEVFRLEVDGKGPKATFRIFIDDTLWETIEKSDAGSSTDGQEPQAP